MVNTFLVSIDLEENARMLDNQRLGKQRVEAMQIINVLEKGGKGWSNHKCTVMWRGYVDCLKHYTNTIIREWERRGYKNTMETYEVPPYFEKPWWLAVGWKPLLFSHQAMLIRKQPSHYKKLFSPPAEYFDVGYIWPGDIDPLTVLDILNDENIDPISLAAPTPGHLVNPRYCSAVIKSGANKGKECGRILQDENTVCGVHATKVKKLP